MEHTASEQAWPRGDGEMARLIRVRDWAATPLGPITGWPRSLQMVVDLILDSPLGMIVLWGPELVQIYNDGYAAVMGAKHPGGLGQPTRECWPEAWSFNEPVLEAVLRGERRSFTDQEFVLERDGRPEPAWFDLNYGPVRDEGGAIAGVLVTVVETTGRVRAERVLRTSEERFRSFADNSADTLWIIDAETGQIEYLSPAFETMWGESRDAVMDDLDRWLALVHPEDRVRAAQAMPRTLDGEVLYNEYRIVRPSDGAVRWINDTGFPIRDADGRVRRVAGVAQDVTARVEGERALAESERRLRGLVEGVPQLVWRAADGGRWTWASPQWNAYTGQAEADSHGMGWLDAVHPDDRERAVRAWSDAPERGRYEADYRIRQMPENGYRWFQTRSSPVRNQAGEVVEWLGTSTDVDELRTLQERQQLLVAELQHRVRNILTVVRSVFSRTAAAGTDLEEAAEHFQGRLAALARTQVIVTREAAGTAYLEDLIRDELLSVGVADGQDVRIEGPEVVLTSKAAESIGLAIHELTTNALKYGALKIPSAKLYVNWTVNTGKRGEPTLNLTWTEQGVPAISLNPTRQGFGRELIEEALPYRLGAETKLEFRGGGVRCSISMPLRADRAEPTMSAGAI